MYDIVIIGGGPAGLTAAIYGRRANKKVLVLEALTPGGQIINTTKIDNYPGLPHVSGVDFATSLYNQVIELGAEIKFEKVISVKYPIVTTKDNTYNGKAIIIATGADKRKLGLEKEEYFNGRGLSYCATCDGNFYKNQDVCVYGSGDTAIDDAMYLSDICKNVYLVTRSEHFKGSELSLKELENKDNVHLIYNTVITDLIGSNNLTGIVTKSNNEVKELEVNGLFVAIGQVPETESFINIIDVDDNGYAITGEDMRTKVPGIYVAGDVRKKNLRQLSTAISDGAIAATEAIQDINNKVI